MTTKKRPSGRRLSSLIPVAAFLGIGILALGPAPPLHSAQATAQRPEMKPEPRGGEPAARAQQGRVQAAPAARSHLRLTLRVSQSGLAEVVAATEVSGEAVLSDVARGDFVYEVAVGGRTLVVQGVIDPFERRSFPGPDGSPQQGHHFDREETATLVVKVPDADGVRKAAEALTVRLYKLRPGTASMETIDSAQLERLKRDYNLDLVAQTTHRP
jgi:hypothetical protein